MEEERKEEGVKVVGYWVSLFTLRVRWALALKGIPYQYIEQDIFNKTPLLKQLNPVYAKVPVLLHNGNPLPESTIILEYIDQIWNHYPLLPQHPYDRAQARFWAKFVDQKIIDSAWLLMFLEGEKKEIAVKVLIERLDKIEQKIKEGNTKFLGGETIGYLDLVLGFVAYSLAAWEEVATVKIVESSKFPGLATWTSDFLNHPAIKAAYLPPMAEAVSFYQKWQKELLPFFESPAGEKLVSTVLEF